MRRTLACLLFAGIAGFAQQQAPRVVSPEVLPDNRVTFRLFDPNAKEVQLAREGAARVPMQKDEQGVFSITLGPLEPDFYGYSFIADGATVLDPVNPLIKPNLLATQNMVHVPADNLPWEVGATARGIVHHHFYRSSIVRDNRDFFVYTPPNYDPAGKPYPVLYLLHGFSDDASGWTAVGRANVILDNLIGQGKARPMLVVMPLGYGAPEIVSARGTAAFRDEDLRKRNYDRFRETLLSEVMPMVEKTYRVSGDRTMRAIAGLSMGGAESLLTGLNNVDRFAWIGAFSSGGLGGEFAAAFPGLDAKETSKLKLLWIACGTEDGLIEPNRKFVEWLKSKEIRVTPVETPGAHTWMVWRRNLATFAPMLFQ